MKQIIFVMILLTGFVFGCGEMLLKGDSDISLDDSNTEKVNINISSTNISIPVDGLVAYYSFDGNADDESGNENNGNINGATLTKDRFDNPNSAYSFNGVNNYINVPNLINYPSISSDKSGFAWVKTTKTNTKIYDDNIIELSIDSNGNFEAFGKGYRSCGISDISVIDNKWHFVGITFQIDTYVNTLYVDGVKVKTCITENGLSGDRTAIKSFFGVFQTLSDYFFEGSIDDIRIYDRSLTEIEIQALYQEN